MCLENEGPVIRLGNNKVLFKVYVVNYLKTKVVYLSNQNKEVEHGFHGSTGAFRNRNGYQCFETEDEAMRYAREFNDKTFCVPILAPRGTYFCRGIVRLYNVKYVIESLNACRVNTFYLGKSDVNYMRKEALRLYPK